MAEQNGKERRPRAHTQKLMVRPSKKMCENVCKECNNKRNGEAKTKESWNSTVQSRRQGPPTLCMLLLLSLVAFLGQGAFPLLRPPLCLCLQIHPACAWTVSFTSFRASRILTHLPHHAASVLLPRDPQLLHLLDLLDLPHDVPHLAICRMISLILRSSRDRLQASAE